jgi:uncharacterized membrane protein YqaE (UPF0057 family)
MKKIILPALAVIAFAITFNSCTMEKRHYRNGYYIDRNNHKEVTATPSAKQAVAVENAAIVETTQATAPVISAPAEQGVMFQPASANETSKPVVSNKTIAAKLKTSTSATTVKESARPSIAQSKVAKKANHPTQAPEKGLLIVLAILIPWLAVGLVTDWDAKTLIINLLLCLTCIGGIIHAIIVVNKNA